MSNLDLGLQQTDQIGDELYMSNLDLDLHHLTIGDELGTSLTWI